MSKLRKHIVFVHLLNDYSGSPLVLSQAINAAEESLFEKTLYTSISSREGFLTGLTGVQTNYFWYRWQANPWLRLVTFLTSQAILFFKLLRYRKKDVTIYVNTLLPFGAALAGKLMGKKVIYHVHETTIKPAPLKFLLRWVANHTASAVIHVSKYLSATERFSKPENLTIYNSLSGSFIKTAELYNNSPAKKDEFMVLMLCSLKQYKGVDEFVSLARRLPALRFELVLNATQMEMDKYFLLQQVPENLFLHPVQKNVHPFYQRASLLINLSHPDKWIETFGMTVLEGMYYKLPAIVPPVGGITELVDDGINGYCANSKDVRLIANHIQTLATDHTLYNNMCAAAYHKSVMFSGPLFKQKIIACISGVENQQAGIHTIPQAPLKSISI